ncbi:MAG: hypothetical protein ACKO6F_04125 [Cyanobium sp.]
MLRWLMLGLLIAGLGIGIQRQWVSFDFRRFVTDLGVPFLADPEPTRLFQFQRPGS